MVNIPNPALSGSRLSVRSIEEPLLELLNNNAGSIPSRIVVTGAPGNGVQTLTIKRLPALLGERAHLVDPQRMPAMIAAGKVAIFPSVEALRAMSAEQLASVHVVVCGLPAQTPAWFRTSGPIDVIEVPVLTLTEVREFLAARLGGQVGPAEVSELGRAAGYIPNILATVVRQLVTSGGLVHTGSHWSLTSPPTGGILAAKAALWAASLPPEAGAMLQRIAFEQPVPDHVLAHTPLMQLINAGHVRQTESGSVEVRAPILAEAIRHNASPELTASSYQRALQTNTPSAHALQWALLRNLPVSDRQLLAAVESLKGQHDWRTSIELIEASLPTSTPPVQVELLLQLAHACRFRGSTAESEAALVRSHTLAETDLPESDDYRARIAAALADIAHYTRDDLDDALRTVRAAEVTVTSVHAVGSLTTQRLLHQSYGGRSTQFLGEYAEAAVKRSLAHASATDRARVRVASCLALAAAGRPKYGYKRALRIKAELSLRRHEGAWLREELDAAIFVCAISATGPSHMHGIARALDRPLGRDTPPAENIAFDLAHATWFLACGDTITAKRITELAATAAEVQDPSGFASALDALRAQLAALHGNTNLATRLLREHHTIPIRSSASIVGGVSANLFAARYLIKAPGNTTRSLLEQAQNFIECGQHGFAAELLHAGVRFGKRQPSAALVVLKEHLDGTLNAARIAHADALLGGDPLALTKVAVRYEALGLPLFAAETYSLLLCSPDLPKRIRRFAQTAVRLLCDSIHAPGHPLLARFTSPVVAALTPREQQINDFIEAGLSNTEIAERLHLSLRTIEGHITRLYQKTGDTRRAPSRTPG